MRRAAPFPHKTVLSVIAGAWLIIALLHATGLDEAAGHHQLAHAILESRHLGLTVVAILGMWQAMVAAMMLPSCFRPITYVTRNTLPARRGVGVGEFLLGYFGVWTLFGGAATAADAALHRLWHQLAAAVPDSRIPLVAILAMAVIWQVAPLKRASLRRCDDGRVLAAHGWRADAACLGFGLRYGANCVASCWALMLLMFATGSADPVTMATLAMFVWAEKSGAISRFVARWRPSLIIQESTLVRARR